jgi:hypothetical protein
MQALEDVDDHDQHPRKPFVISRHHIPGGLCPAVFRRGGSAAAARPRRVGKLLEVRD